MGNGSNIKTLLSVLIVLVLITAVGGGWYFIKLQKTLPSDEQAQAEQTTASEFCANNPSVDLNIRLKDKLNSTESYENNTVLAWNKKTNKITSASTGGTSTYSANTNFLVCGNPYTIVVRSTVDDDNGGWTLDLTASETMVDPVYVDGEYTDVGLLQARIFDNDNNAFVYDNDATAGYENLGATATSWNSTTGNTTQTAVGSDGCVDIRIDFKTQTADDQFGIKTLLALDIADDSNANDWSSDSIVVKYEGTTLNDIIGTIDEDSRLMLTGYEKLYDFGEAVDDLETSIELDVCASSGVNPDYDLGFWMVGSGVYTSDDNANQLIGTGTVPVVSRTDSSHTAIITATNQKGALEIS